MAGVFYLAAQEFVRDELDRRKGLGYVESRKVNGCYISINARRTEPVTQNYQDLDTGQAIKDGLGTAGRGATDILLGRGASNVLFGEAKESEAMETKQRVVGHKIAAEGQISTLADTSLSSRYATTSGRPSPAIQKFTVEMSGDYGSLVKCILQIKCFDKQSFEEFEKIYMIPGTDVNIAYGRVGVSGPANNDEFSGVVYDYSFKMNNELGYDCEIKAVGKGNLITELNVNSKLADDGREFTSDFAGLNETQTCVNIFDVFDYDVQDRMDDHEDLDEDEGYVYPGMGGVAHIAGCDCPDAAPEPANDNMVGGNVIFASLGYVINKLINKDLLQGNIESQNVDVQGIQYVCNNNVTIGKEYDKLFSANPMKILIRGTDSRGSSHYGGTGGGAIGRFFGASKIWGKNFPNPLVMDGTGTAKIANTLISRDLLRSIAGASEMGGEGSKIGIGKFLNKLFSEIYNHTGGAWDLTVTQMTPEQASHYGEAGGDKYMYVVDRNWVPGSAGQTPKLEFNAGGHAGGDNSTRNVQLTGKVPKDMAAAAFVGGTGTASGKKNAAVEVIKGEQVVTLVNKAKIRNSLIESREVIHDTGYNEESISAAKSNLKSYVESAFEHSDKAGFRKDMYPLEMSATLEGIAGIQFGNACITNLAPSRYYTNNINIVFTVKKTIHELTPNQWTTEVETICRIEK